MSTNKLEEEELHLVMFPFFAFGHITPFVQLSNKLASHGFKISFLTASGNLDRLKPMFTRNPAIQIIPITLPHVDGLPPDAQSTADAATGSFKLFTLALNLIQPQIKTLLSQLKPHYIFIDFAQHSVPPLAARLGIKTIYFTVFTAIATAYYTSFDGITKPTIDVIKKPPGSSRFTPRRTYESRKFLNIFNCFDDTELDCMLKTVNACDVIVMKSCREMEASYIEYMERKYKKPVLLTGPLVPDPWSGDKLDEPWAKWLDQFGTGSVIYCSFGSETFLTDEQIRELALGLELTGQPFFLVLNFPAGVDKSTELNRALPDGFVNRVHDKGIVHSGWVQQRLILAHDSVGCYLNHAGYGSVMEALVNDCQLVMLPLKGDQFFNCKVVESGWEAGVEVNRREEDGYFGKFDVCEAVKKVMTEVDSEPTKSVRANHKKWKEFLKDNEVQDKFIVNLVNDMKALV